MVYVSSRTPRISIYIYVYINIHIYRHTTRIDIYILYGANIEKH